MQASPFWDARMFQKFQDKLGGKVRFVISGGAPLALQVEEFLMTVLCCPVLQVRMGSLLSKTPGACLWRPC